MIKVTFTESHEKLSLRIEGHAGYAEHGKDIVCASASILAYTVAQYVEYEDNQGNLNAPAEIRLESGDTVVSCEPKEEILKWLWDAYQFAKMGFLILAHNYPQYVSLDDLT
jgi:uncharacterized protein YsxB (DUF464 family)